MTRAAATWAIMLGVLLGSGCRPVGQTPSGPEVADERPEPAPSPEPAVGKVVEASSAKSLPGGEWTTVVQVDTTFEQTGPEEDQIAGNRQWVDVTPVCEGLAEVAAAIGPYAGAQARLGADEWSEWSGTYWIELNAKGRARKVDRWGYDFGFDELEDIERRLPALRCTPARRDGRDVEFTIFVLVTLRWVRV